MKFQEAKEKLLELVGDKFCSVEFKETIFGHNSSKEETICRVYVEGFGFQDGPTWDVALGRMEIKVKHIPDKLEELPEVDA